MLIVKEVFGNYEVIGFKDEFNVIEGRNKYELFQKETTRKNTTQKPTPLTINCTLENPSEKLPPTNPSLENKFGTKNHNMGMGLCQIINI